MNCAVTFSFSNYVKSHHVPFLGGHTVHTVLYRRHACLYIKRALRRTIEISARQRFEAKYGQAHPIPTFAQFHKLSGPALHRQAPLRLSLSSPSLVSQGISGTQATLGRGVDLIHRSFISQSINYRDFPGRFFRSTCCLFSQPHRNI